MVLPGQETMLDSSGNDSSGRTTRRGVLRLSGVALAGSLAGCSGGLSGSTPSGTSTESTGPGTNGTETTGSTTTTTEPVPSLKTEYDPRERFSSPGKSFDAMEDLSTWNTNQGSMKPDQSTAFSGDRSAKLVGENGDHGVIETSFAPTDFTDRDLSVALRTTTPESIAFFVQLLDENGNAAEHHLRSITMSPSDVGWFRTCPGTYDSDSGFDRSAVTRLRLRMNNATDGKAVAWVDDVRTHPKPDTGYVIFSWDDGKRSYYRNAAPLHDMYGFPAVITQPPHPSDAGSKLFMTPHQLRERQSEGDEVVAHGSVSSPFAKVSRTKLNGILRRNKQWLIDNDIRGADFVVYPGNNYDATALDVLGDYHYMGGMNQSGSVNTTGAHGFDPLVLPRTIGHDLDIAKRLVDQVAANRNVGILNFHDFGNKNTMNVTKYEALLQHVDATDGVEAITFSDLWEMRKTG